LGDLGGDTKVICRRLSWSLYGSPIDKGAIVRLLFLLLKSKN
jgi:hypothetical protein